MKHISGHRVTSGLPERVERGEADLETVIPRGVPAAGLVSLTGACGRRVIAESIAGLLACRTHDAMLDRHRVGAGLV